MQAGDALPAAEVESLRKGDQHCSSDQGGSFAAQPKPKCPAVDPSTLLPKMSVDPSSSGNQQQAPLENAPAPAAARKHSAFCGNEQPCAQLAGLASIEHQAVQDAGAPSLADRKRPKKGKERHKKGKAPRQACAPPPEAVEGRNLAAGQQQLPGEGPGVPPTPSPAATRDCSKSESLMPPNDDGTGTEAEGLVHAEQPAGHAGGAADAERPHHAAKSSPSPQAALQPPPARKQSRTKSQANTTAVPQQDGSGMDGVAATVTSKETHRLKSTPRHGKRSPGPCSSADKPLAKKKCCTISSASGLGGAPNVVDVPSVVGRPQDKEAATKLLRAEHPAAAAAQVSPSTALIPTEVRAIREAPTGGPSQSCRKTNGASRASDMLSMVSHRPRLEDPSTVPSGMSAPQAATQQSCPGAGPHCHKSPKVIIGSTVDQPVSKSLTPGPSKALEMPSAAMHVQSLDEGLF